MLLLAAALIVDGLLGPRMSPMNLAGVLPWTYWRGLMVVGLLAIGNAVCMVCPFMLPRALAKRLLPARRAWPRWLRGKWLALALHRRVPLRLRSLRPVGRARARPRRSPSPTSPRPSPSTPSSAAPPSASTSARSASFNSCRRPSSPFSIGARGARTSAARASRPTACAATTVSGGCELELFIPEKRGNLDCTFCMDCVRACPHDNVGLLAVAPAAELAVDAPRSSLRRLSERPDVAAARPRVRLRRVRQRRRHARARARRRGRGSPRASASHRRWR